MAVGLKTDFLWYQIGDNNFLHSFFSTICYNLENEKWGDKYPTLMKNLNVTKIILIDPETLTETIIFTR